MSEVIARRAFTVDEYYRMAETGILTESDRVELIDGEIIAMSPIRSIHASIVDRLTRIFHEKAVSAAIIRVQSPVRLGSRSEPEPDVMLLKFREDFYSDSHPTPDDVLLLIEVSDTTLAYDRRVKLPLYARSGIPEVWIVNIGESVVEAHWQPEDGLYAERCIARNGESLSVQSIAGVKVRVNEILG